MKSNWMTGMGCVFIGDWNQGMVPGMESNDFASC